MRKRDISSLQKWNLTIHDVAELADVSPMTVSRVINGKPGVSAEKRERVSRIISEVGFQPHIGAQSMRHSCGDSIGVIFSTPIEYSPFSNETYLSRLIGLVYQIFGKDGDFICLDLNPGAKNIEENYARGLWQQRYGACIVAGALAVNDKTIHRIHASERPYVALARLSSLPEINCATVDLELAAYSSAKYLLERGHKRIAMLSAFEGYEAGEERKRGYFRAHEDAGVEPDAALIRSVTYGAQQAPNAVYRLLLDRDVTALIDASANEDASSLREGARLAGRSLGKDVDTVVWTYTDDVHILDEASAHVWLPIEEAAAEGLELLRQWVHNGPHNGPIQAIYPPTLFQTAAGTIRPMNRSAFQLVPDLTGY